MAGGEDEAVAVEPLRGVGVVAQAAAVEDGTDFRAAERQAEVKALLDTLRAWGSYLGDEVAVGIAPDASGNPGAPIALTTVVKPGFREFVEAEIARTGAAGKRGQHSPTPRE